MWKEQYERIIRGVARLEGSYSGLTGLEHYDGAHFADFRDAVIHVFQDILHLRDWLKNDPAVTVPAQDLDRLFSGNVAASRNLHAARDVANGSKHLVINSPSISADTKVSRTGQITWTPSGTMRDSPIKHSINIDLGSGNFVDALDLARRCVDDLNGFLGSRGLI